MRRVVVMDHKQEDLKELQTYFAEGHITNFYHQQV